MANSDTSSYIKTIEKIIAINDDLREFWTSADGWVPIEAAQLLSKSRLDWQVSLSQCLKIWGEKTDLENQAGRLILAWTNLGSLVEETLKLFLSVWIKSYKKDVKAYKRKNRFRKPSWKINTGVD